jgi:hypothetical protein
MRSPWLHELRELSYIVSAIFIGILVQGKGR